MNLPAQIPFVYAITFLIWGWAGDEMPIAIAAAFALEAPRWLRFSLDVDERAYRMAWLLALLLQWLLAINGWLELSRLEAVRMVLKWTPLALFPIAMASALARQPGVPVSSLLLLLRRRYTRPSMGGVVPRVPRFDPFMPYVWVLLLAASYQEPGRWFFPAALAATTLLMVAQQGTARRRWRVLLLTAAAAAGGVLCASGIVKLYRTIESAIYGRLQGPSAQEINRTLTRIGSVDEVKTRKDILWRARLLEGTSPGYLYEATYDSFDPRQNAWNNTDRVMRRFDSLLPAEHGQPPESWKLGPDTAVTSSIQIRGLADTDFTVLPVPHDTRALQSLPAYRMDRNGLGVLRADSALPILDFVAQSGTTPPLRPAPDPARDLALDQRHWDIIGNTAGKLDLAGKPAAEVAARVTAFFQDGFTYTRDIKKLPLRDFLDGGERGRRGHCEYFATATVLLLRAGGVPARYHTGFALMEFDPAKRTWKVRGSHGHAWASAWLDGRWQVIDTTPPDWLAADTSDIGLLQHASDWWNEKWLAFQEWRASRESGGLLAWLSPLLAALAILYTILRLHGGRRKKAARRNIPAQTPLYPEWNGWSPWREILPSLEARLGPRPPHLAPLAWIATWTDCPDSLRAPARQLALDHQRRRFGPPPAARQTAPHPAPDPLPASLQQARDSLRSSLGIS